MTLTLDNQLLDENKIKRAITPSNICKLVYIPDSLDPVPLKSFHMTESRDCYQIEYLGINDCLVSTTEYNLLIRNNKVIEKSWENFRWETEKITYHSRNPKESYLGVKPQTVYSSLWRDEYLSQFISISDYLNNLINDPCRTVINITINGKDVYDPPLIDLPVGETFGRTLKKRLFRYLILEKKDLASWLKDKDYSLVKRIEVRKEAVKVFNY